MSDRSDSKQMMTVDRIEGDIAVLERGLGDMIDVPLSELPSGVREGTVLSYEAGTWTIDHGGEETRRQKIAKLKALLFKH